MRQHHLQGVVLAISTIIGAVAAPRNAYAIRVSAPPTREYASQTWVGFSDDDLYTIRIHLNADGTGSGTLLFSVEAPEPFDVTSWTLNQRALVLSVHFHNPEKSVSRITGSFKQYLLSYTSGMLPDPPRLSTGHLPGRLELSFKYGGRSIRFGAWPDHELNERLRLVTGTPGAA